MNSPQISVITISYNAVNEIENTLLSVINQKYSNIEYIVVDGGSNDGTVDIIRKYENYIDKWISEPDNGIYDAMNKGIDMASGEWLNFMNSGDMFLNDMVLENVFSKDYPDSISFLYSNYWLSDKQGKFFLRTAERKLGHINHQSSIYKKKLHAIYGYYLTQKPYSVYDLIFFLSVPENNFYKLPFEISKNDGNGITSQGYWTCEKAEAARALFGIKSLNSAAMTLFIRKFKDSIPHSLFIFVKKYVLRKKDNML